MAMARIQNCCQKPLRSEHGLAVIGVVFIVLTMLSLALVASTLLFAVMNQTRAAGTCRRAVLKAQYDMIPLLESLQKLNPQARQLRLERKHAESAFRSALATGIPYAIAAARANLAQVVARQMVLRTKQEGLLSEAVHRRLLLVNDLRRTNVDGFSFLSVELEPRSMGLGTRKIPPADLTPDHVTDPSFTDKQASIVKWRADLLLKSGSEMRQKVSGGLTVTGTCGATLRKESSRWKPALKAARYSLN